jgi:hypothetical protein
LVEVETAFRPVSGAWAGNAELKRRFLKGKVRDKKKSALAMHCHEVLKISTH